jgi:protein-disulfide isomerase
MQLNQVFTRRAGHTHISIKYGLKLALVCCLGLSFCQTATALPQAPKKTVEADVATLKTEVATLLQTQKQILDQLSELKKLVQAAPPAIAAVPNAGPGAPPVPQMPTSMDTTGLISQGDSNAHIAIIEYTDFECPFCGRYARETYPQIEQNYIKTGKVRYFYRDFPLAMHPHAIAAAQAARCANDQGKFWEMHDSLFANQDALTETDFWSRAQSLGLNADQFKQCLSSQKYADTVTQSITAGNGYGITGAPMFYIGSIGQNGVVTIDKTVTGAQPYENFQSAIDYEFAPKA